MKVHAPPQRVTTLVAALLSSTLLLAGCGSGSDTDSADSGESTSGGETSVTVPAAYGEFTLDSKPTRIVVIGVENVDLLNALGEKPVAFAAAGETDVDALNAGSPWIADLYSADEYDPSLITSEYKVSKEAVAEQNPDLIIGSSFYIEEPQYEELSKLAPTYVKVTSPDRDWKTDLTDLGALLGKQEEAANALAELGAEYADAKANLPGLQGKTINTGWYNEGGVRMPPTYSWVEDLGLVPAANQPSFGTPAVTLSAENLEQFAGDVAILSATDSERAALEADPRYSRLPSVENGTFIFSDRTLIDAGLSAGPASLSWLLTEIVPTLEQSTLNTEG